MQEVIEISLDKLITPYFNPRNHPQEQVYNLSLSLKEFGQRRTIAAWPVGDGTYEVLAGNGIKQAAEMAGWSKLTCTLAPKDMTTLQRKAYALADNQGGAVDDMTKVAQILEEVSSDGRIALEALGSSQAGLDALLEDLANQALQGQEPGNGGDEFDTEPPRVAVRCKPGDLWALGRHRLLVGDCTDKAQVDRLMQGADAEITFTDPPYNVGMVYNDASDDNKTPEEYIRFSSNWFSNCPSNAVVFTPGIVNLAMWYTKINPPKWLCSWRKSNQCSNSGLGGFNTWEPILVYGKLQVRVGHDSWDIPVRQEMDKDNPEHPVAKTLSAWQAFLEDFSTKGSTIFEPFLGSGTTLIAAERTGRKCYGMEISDVYGDVIINRWEAETNSQAKLIERVTND